VRVGIDYVSLVLFLVGYGVSQVRSLSPSARHASFAAAMTAIALSRLALGARGVNLAFAAIAGVLGAVFFARAWKARDPR
jgi:hypothetical protein